MQWRLFSIWLLQVFDGVPRGPLRMAPVDSSGLAPRGSAIRFPPHSAPRATNGPGDDPYLLPRARPVPPSSPFLSSAHIPADVWVHPSRCPYVSFSPGTLRGLTLRRPPSVPTVRSALFVPPSQVLFLPHIRLPAPSVRLCACLLLPHRRHYGLRWRCVYIPGVCFVPKLSQPHLLRAVRQVLPRR